MRHSRSAATCLVVSLSVFGTLAPATAAALPPGFTETLVTDPDLPTSTAPTTITVTTKNVGGELAGASSTRLYRSANSTIDAGDALLHVFAIAPLAANSSEVSAVTLVLPAGTYFLIAQVDAASTVNEVNEANNAKRVKKTVP